MISIAHFKRLIYRFIDTGDIQLLETGGCTLSFSNCSYSLYEKADWQNGQCMVTYVFFGEDWTIKLFDVPGTGRGRVLQVVEMNGDEDAIERALREFKL